MNRQKDHWFCQLLKVYDIDLNLKNSDIMRNHLRVCDLYMQLKFIQRCV